MSELPAHKVVPTSELLPNPIEDGGHWAVPHELEVNEIAEGLRKSQSVAVKIIQWRFQSKAVVGKDFSVKHKGEKRQESEIGHITVADLLRGGHRECATGRVNPTQNIATVLGDTTRLRSQALCSSSPGSLCGGGSLLSRAMPGRFPVDLPEARAFDIPRGGEAHSQVRAGVEQEKAAPRIQAVGGTRRQRLPRPQ